MKRTPEKAQHNRKKRPTPRYFIRKMQNIRDKKKNSKNFQERDTRNHNGFRILYSNMKS